MKLNDFSKENSGPKIPLIVIGSPTATGKTVLALHLACRIGAAIVNADSLQVYRFMDIGTAKPTLDERRRVEHHLIDVVEPDQSYNAAIYSTQARLSITRLHLQGKPIIVVGGTGLYIRALLRGIIETPPVDEALRNHYKDLGRRHGREHLFALLSERDPLAASRINPNDSVRVIRALEVLDQSGESIVALQLKHAFAESPYRTLKIGLRPDREALKETIQRRTDAMMDQGLLEEVRSLLAKGYDEKLKPLQSLGYKQVIAMLRGHADEAVTRQLISRETWLYAKRQMTWFAADPDIRWFHPSDRSSVDAAVDDFMCRSHHENPCPD